MYTHDAALLIVDLTFHGQWHICQFRCQPSCSGKFDWLGSHPSLATRKDATVEVVLPTCHKCSSKACLLSVPFGCERMQLPDSYELAGSKMILNIDCAVQKSEAAKL